MDIQTRKLELMRMILNTNKPSILEKVAMIFEREKTSDFWDNLPDNIKESIEAGIKEADKGDLIPHQEVMKKVKAKYKI